MHTYRQRPVVHPVEFSDTDRPERIESPHRLRALNAAARARKAYPGPAGDVLADALNAYADLGWLARANHPIHRLIAELMDGPPAPAPNIQ
jgi:hypothetical protein